MKIWCILVLCCSLLPSLHAAELKVSHYEVLPGNYYKHFGAKLDTDLTVDQNGKPTRRGLLTDGRISHIPRTGICYVFWQAKPEESCVNFLLKLDKVAAVKEVQVFGQNFTPMYNVTKASLHYGADEFAMTKGATVDYKPEAAAKNQANWKLTIPCGHQTGYLKVTVWTGGSQYLNVTEIKVIGEEGDK